MTSFANAFGSSDEGQHYFNSITIESANNGNTHPELNHFSSIDLDLPSAPSKGNESLYANLNHAATFHSDTPSMNDAIFNGPSRHPLYPPNEIPLRNSFSSSSSATMNTAANGTDRRISLADVSRLSASSAAAVAAVAPTIDKLKQWSRSTFKCTKQSIYEKLGKTTRTVDVELDAQIEQLRETKRRYESMLALARSYANHFANLMHTQRSLSDQFLELKQKSSLLSDEFGYNADTQRILVRNGEILLSALNFFIANLHTLCTKTIEDTMSTIRLYEVSRLEYDACRTELEVLGSSSVSSAKQYEFGKYKERYEKLKSGIAVKLRFLDENQSKVMKNQLVLFHNAIAAYFSGNKEALEATVKQFNLKVTFSNDHDDVRKSFLE